MALCTLEEVYEVLGIDGSKESDNEHVENLITRMTARFENICHRIFESASYDEDYDGDTRRISLRNYPITEITSITDTGSDWTETTTVSGAYYKISRSGRQVIFNSSALLTEGDENITIVYTAGYAANAIPEDLKMACIEEVSRRFDRAKKLDVLSTDKGEQGTTYTSMDFLDNTKDVLSRYTRRAIV